MGNEAKTERGGMWIQLSVKAKSKTVSAVTPVLCCIPLPNLWYRLSALVYARKSLKSQNNKLIVLYS